MVSPIDSAAAVGFTDEAAIKNRVNPAPSSSDAVKPELGAQAVPKLDEADDSAKVKQSGVEQGTPAAKTEKGEVRKVVLEDGKVSINVYDCNGKLLRKTPPGYLPAGEQGYDITV